MLYRSTWIHRLIFVVAACLVSRWAMAQNPGARPPGPHPPSQKLKNPIPMGEDSVKRGKEAYGRFCADCHAADGSGETDLLEFMTEPPGDFRDAVWRYGETDGEIFSIIRDGTAFDMEAFKDRFTDNGTWDLVNFLRSLGPPVEKAAAAPVELKNPFPYSEASVRQGKQAYVRFCVTCHGADGRGQTDMVEFLSEPPSDLTNGKWKYGGTDGEIFRIIRDGTPNDMESFKDRLTDERMWHVVNYLRRLGPGPK